MKNWKIPGIISLFSVATIAAVVTLVLLSSTAKEKGPSSLEGLKAGEMVAISDKDRTEETRFSLSSGDSLQTMEQTAAIVKKRFERIRAEKVLLADKETLLNLLPPVKDWQMGNRQYHRGGYGEEETTNLNVDFSGEDSMKIRVEIVDYGAAPAALQPLKMIFKMEKEDVAEPRADRVSDYNGNLVLEEYNRKLRQRQFSSILNDRYLIKLKIKGKNTREILQDFTRQLFAGNN